MHLGILKMWYRKTNLQLPLSLSTFYFKDAIRLWCVIASYCYTFLGHTSRTDGESVVQETAAGELQEMNYQQKITHQTNQNRFRIYTIVHSMYFADAFCMFCLIEDHKQTHSPTYTVHSANPPNHHTLQLHGLPHTSLCLDTTLKLSDDLFKLLACMHAYYIICNVP